MKIDTLFVAIAIALACVRAGAVQARAQDAASVFESQAPADASNDAALAEREEQAHALATKRLNQRTDDSDLERTIPWTERGGAAGWANRYGTAAPSRGV